MRPKHITRVRAYWEGLRKNGALPQRADVDPRALPDLLPNVFLLEHVAPSVVRFRHTGALLPEIMGMDVRGMPFLSLIDPGEREALVSQVDRVFHDPAILDMELASAVPGPARLGARIVLLPLQTFRGVDMALGCIETEGLIGRPPRRFRPLRVLSERVGVLEPGAGFAEPAAPFAPGRPALRLVHSSDHKISRDDDPRE
ncbi:PAS domain-containing protein [Falsirhodobacter sp. 20TX0035]|uniref:PAS domain-containing protein n=1 Tax=Falsirhodobacter sp. 20TX0035 TaxID=3022019 RepID=UPI0023309840|nr:PAS domain-containing protein [Falsirhodobacter sp. 20TX0035]MDB6453177.1 PAS domain-containing protein [Falsirhodobacter sp. 20TX0035]